MTTRLYLGRLPQDIRRSDIEDLFKGYGRLLDVRIMGNFGFAEFEHPRDAEDAIKDFDGKNFMGERILVQPAKAAARREPGGDPYGPPGGFGGRGGHGAPPRSAPRLRRGQFRLIVSNLPPSTSWQDLKDIGREHGSISFADIDPHRPDEGIIEYDNREDYERALDRIEGTELRGYKLRIDPAEPPRGGRDRERSPPPPRRRDDSPPPRRRDDRDDRDDRDASPPRRREDSREPLPPRSSRYDSRSPPPARERDYDERPPRED